MNHSSRSACFELLLQAAFASSQMRVLNVIFQEDVHYGSGIVGKRIPYSEKQRLDRSHPFDQACDAARNLCEVLARYCRRFNIDPRLSPLYEGLGFKEEVEKILERNRVVECEVLTPAAIFHAAEKGNKLLYDGWQITVGSADFATDAYGQDQWCEPLIISKVGSEPIILWMPGESKDRAREAYREITGEKFPGDDGLGKDPLHAYERYCGLS